MFFLGEYEHSIDAKQRLAIPAEVRDVLDPEVHGSAFVAAPGGITGVGRKKTKHS